MANPKTIRWKVLAIGLRADATEEQLHPEEGPLKLPDAVQMRDEAKASGDYRQVWVAVDRS